MKPRKELRKKLLHFHENFSPIRNYKGCQEIVSVKDIQHAKFEGTIRQNGDSSHGLSMQMEVSAIEAYVSLNATHVMDRQNDQPDLKEILHIHR